MNLVILASLFSLAVLAEENLSKFPVLGAEKYPFAEKEGKFISILAIQLNKAFKVVDFTKSIEDAMRSHDKELRPFFKPNELHNLLVAVNQKANQDIIGSGTLTEDKAREILALNGRKLIPFIYDRLLESKGVKDPSRRQLWADQLLKPYESCVAKATNFYGHTQHCFIAFSETILPNVGLAISYEKNRDLILQESKIKAEEKDRFLESRASTYLHCAKNIKEMKTSDVIICAANSILEANLLPMIDQNMALYKEIEAKIFPQFKACLSDYGKYPTEEKKEKIYVYCIDKLMDLSGREVVAYKIRTTSAVTNLYQGKDLENVIRTSQRSFAECIFYLQEKNIRNDGMVDVSKCDNKVTNEITFLVVDKSFADTADTSSKDFKIVEKLKTQGTATLRSCWKSDQSTDAKESCIRKSIIIFADSVSKVALDAAIPADVKTKDQISKDSQELLRSCLNTNLAARPSEDAKLTAKIDLCKSKTVLSAALATADVSIRDIGSDIRKNILDNIVTSLVQNDFAQCLGAAPSETVLESCTNKLKMKGAKVIGAELFEKNMFDFIKKNGGHEVLGISKAGAELFLSKLKQSTGTCIDSSKYSISQDVMVPINQCLKKSTKSLALLLGTALFEASAKSMYKDRDDDYAKFKSEFNSALTLCLAEKDGSQFDIPAYTQNIETCSNRVAKETMLILGSDQIDFNLNNYLNDTPTVTNKERRESIKTDLITSFKACIDTTINNNSCIGKLKKEATSKIVLSYGKSQIQAQLLTDKTPEKLKPVEATFKTCVEEIKDSENLDKSLDLCLKNYAGDFAKTLGELKLNSLLISTLGSQDFIKNKKQIDSLLSDYNKCIEEIKDIPINEGYLTKLGKCPLELEKNGTRFASIIFDEWLNMKSINPDQLNLELKRNLVRILPCLSGIMPSSPWQENNNENVQSLLKPGLIILGQYIDYDSGVAKRTIDEIFAELKGKLPPKDFDKLKMDLIKLMYKNGTLDLAMKSYVRSIVLDKFNSIKNDEIPGDLKAELSKPETFNKIFSGNFGKEILDQVMNNIFKPLLINGQSLDSPMLSHEVRQIENKVINELVNSTHFGTKLIDYSIEKELKNQKWYIKLVGQIAYSKEAFNWQKLKHTKSGEIVEKFIKNNYLLPKFQGINLSEMKTKEFFSNVEKLVTEAIKKYQAEKK